MNKREIFLSISRIRFGVEISSSYPPSLNMIPARYFVQESMIVKSSNAPRPALPPPPPPPLHANHAHLIDLVVKNDQYVTEQVRTLNMDVDEVEMKDDQGRTALHFALSRKDINIDLVHVLVEKGCGALSSKDNRGRLPLYVACENNAPLEIIKLLLEMNASTITRQHNAATSADKSNILPASGCCIAPPI